MSSWGYRTNSNANDMNRTLPYINTPKYSSIDNNDGRKSSFDYLKNDPLYSKEAFVEQTQFLDQLKSYKDEISRRDRSVGFNSPSRFDATVSATTKYNRNEYSVSQIRDLQMQLDQRDDRIQRLQATLDAHKEADEQNMMTIQQLRRQLMMQESGNDFGGKSINGSNVIIGNLQRELKESQQRIMELESRLRTHMEEREKAEQERENAEQQLRQLTNNITNSLLLLDVAGGGMVTMTTEEIIEKVNETMHENTMLKGKLTNMKSILNGVEAEREVDKQTIMRLTNDIERGHHSISKNNLEFENIRVERDTALTRQEEFKKEVDVLRERLEVNQRSWGQMKRDIEELRERNSLLEADKLRSSVHNNTDGIRFGKFRENLAALLSDVDNNVDPYEESIMERIKNIQTFLNEKNLRVDMLERKLTTLANELDQQYQQSKIERSKTKQTLVDMEDLQDQLKRVQTKESINQYIDNNRNYSINETQFRRMLNKIRASLMMSSSSLSSPYNDDVTMEMIVEDIIARINDVMARFGDDDGGGSDEMKRVHIKNLQKKVRSLKEQLATKESQSEMLKDKVRVMEDRMMSLEMKLSNDNDDELTRNDKMAKILEKYRLELNEAHLELRQLRNKIVEASNLKADAVEREEEIKRLELKLRQQEQQHSRQLQQLDNMQLDQQRVQQLIEELGTTKTALDEITRQHKQLFELRLLLSRMLGISYDTSVAIDFEIISRLEKLISASYNHPDLMNNSFIIDPSHSIGLAEEFRRGYNSVIDSQPTNHRPRSGRMGQVNSSGYGRINDFKSRSRSLSPQKRFDPKIY